MKSNSIKIIDIKVKAMNKIFSNKSGVNLYQNNNHQKIKVRLNEYQTDNQFNFNQISIKVIHKLLHNKF